MFLKRNIISLIILFSLFTINSSAQIIKHFGLKSGISNAWQTLVQDDERIHYTNKRVGINIGIFAEWINNPYIGLQTELDFIVKGMETPIMTGEIIREEYILSYLSFIVLPNIHIDISNIKLYAMAGPRLDISLKNSLELEGARYMYNYIKEDLKEYKNLLFGATLGIGLEIKNILPFTIGLESRYSPDFSKVYDIDVFYRKNNSVEILLVIGM